MTFCYDTDDGGYIEYEPSWDEILEGFKEIFKYYTRDDLIEYIAEGKWASDIREELKDYFENAARNSVL